jgi:amino acid adenylation domain-containing protein
MAQDGLSADRDNLVTELLAAQIAVIHRRTRQDVVSVAFRSPALRHDAAISIDLSADPTVAALHEQVETVLLHPATGSPGQEADLRVDAGAGPGATVAYGRSVLDGSTSLEALEKQVRLVLAAGRQSPRCRLSALPMSDAADHALVRAWGRYDELTAGFGCVHQMVAAQAVRVPDAPAVSCGGSVLTYRTLNSWADRLAGLLRESGVGPGQVVGVLADRSPELIVGLLAVLKSGAAYLALENDIPAERRERLLRDARVSMVLSRGDAPVTPPGVRGMQIGGPQDPFSFGIISPIQVRPDDLAYVSYTSGSTGLPKGVAIPHMAVSRLIREPDWADFREHDTFLLLSPVAFDASTFEIWTPLTIGARLTIYPSRRVDAESLANTLVTEGVTVLWLSAGLFHQMVADRLDSLGHLRQVIAGGDVISGQAVRTLLTRHPHLTFTNGYGPTENTTFTTCWTSRTSAPDHSVPISVPIGKPIGGTWAAILDRALRVVPAGVPGELYAAGAGVARGYWGQPAATAERFVPDPLAVDPGARMYRTGDLARWRPDGTIEFLGRADRQVKIRGYRVEPGEVEAALEASPGVHAALVIAEPDAAGGQRLAAFVTPENLRADPPGLASKLRTRLRLRLPSYLVPVRLVVVHRLPLNRNGKVDRSMFENAGRTPRAAGNPYVAPREPVESFLAELLAAMFGVEQVGVHDDFFEIGGHSLIAGELLVRVQQEFGIDLPAREFYLRPTTAGLAEAVRVRIFGPVSK